MSGLRSEDNQHQHIHLESQSPRQVSPFLGLLGPEEVNELNHISLSASDIYELLNGAFQIVPDQLPAWHSLFHSLKMLHFNSALLYVIAINHGILSLNMY